MSSLVDIGVNLTNKRFAKDLDATIERAVTAGVTTMVLTGTSVEESQRAAALAEQHPGALYSTAGVHPHDAKSCDDGTLGALRELLAQPQVVAVGECGLDFNRDFSPRPVQEKWFAEQVALAVELNAPLFVHERDAHERLLGILGEFPTLPPLVVHCFTGEGEVMRKYVERDFHIGITGWICDERRGTHLRDLVREIPVGRLMVETDAPYLTPRDYRPKPKGGRNEPSLLPHIAATVAECRGEMPEQLARHTTETARRFFQLPGGDPR